MNRRGFIGVITATLVNAKAKLWSSPRAASAIPPTCSRERHGFEVRFVTRDGKEIEPSPVLTVSKIDESSNTIWIDGPIPEDGGRDVESVFGLKRA